MSGSELRLRREIAAFNETFTGAMSEVTHDTDTNELRSHDGVTPGGKIVVDVPRQEAAFAASGAARDIVRGRAAFGLANLTNAMPRSYMIPNAAVVAAIQAGAAKLLLVSNSIGAGADLHYPNGWYETITNKLRAEMPFIAWTFESRSIGGATLGNFADPGYVGLAAPGSGGYYIPSGNDQQWPSGSTVGRSWLEEVELQAPDILMICHGMNDDGNENYYLDRLAAIRTEVATWAKVPWLVLGAEFIANTTSLDPPNQFWTNDQNQNGTQAIADAVRALCLKQGYGLIDFNGHHQMLRNGRSTWVDRYKHEANFRYWTANGETDTWISSSVSLSAGVMTFGGPGSILRKVRARDVVQQAVFNLKAANDVPQMATRQRPSGDGGLLLQILTTSSTTAKLQMYCYGAPSPVGELDLPFGITPNCNIYWHSKVVGGVVENWIGKDGGARSHLVFHMPEGFGTFFAGYAGVRITPSGATFGSTISGYDIDYVESDVRVKTGNPSPLYYSEEDLMGLVQGGDINTNPDSVGGDRIHHPSDIGSQLFMIPAANRWADEFHDVVRGLRQATPGVVAFQSELRLLNSSTFTTESLTPPQTFSMQYSKVGRINTIQGFYANASGGSFDIPADRSLVVMLPSTATGSNPTTYDGQALSLGLTLGFVPSATTSPPGGVPSQLVATVAGSRNYAIIRANCAATGGFAEIDTIAAIASMSIGGDFVSGI